METKKCGRCGGKGRGGWAVCHLGIPGLCYECDGTGLLRWMSVQDLTARNAKVASRHLVELQEKKGLIQADIDRLRAKVARGKGSQATEVLLGRREAEMADVQAAVDGIKKSMVEPVRGRWVSMTF